MSQKKAETEKKRSTAKASDGASAKEKNKKEEASSSKNRSASSTRQLTDGKSKGSGRGKAAVEVPRSERMVHQVLPYVLFVMTLFLCACYLFHDSSSKVGVLGKLIYQLFTGLFGWPAFLIPLVLINLAVFWRKYVDMNLVGTKVVLSFLTILFTSSLVQVVAVNRVDEATYKIGEFWKSGHLFLKGGGVLGGLLGTLCWQVIGFVGSLIVLIPGIIVLTMFLLGVTPRYVWTRLRYLWGIRAEQRAEQREIRREREAERRAEEEERLAQQERERYARRLREQQEMERRKKEAEEAAAASVAAGAIFADNGNSITLTNTKGQSKKKDKRKNEFIDLDDLNSTPPVASASGAGDEPLEFAKDTNFDDILPMGDSGNPRKSDYRAPELVIPAEEPKRAEAKAAGSAQSMDAARGFDNADAALILSASDARQGKGAASTVGAGEAAVAVGAAVKDDNPLADLTTLAPVRKKKPTNPLIEELERDDDFIDMNNILKLQVTPEQEMNNTADEAEADLGLEVEIKPIEDRPSDPAPKPNAEKKLEGDTVASAMEKKPTTPAPAATVAAPATATTAAATSKPVVTDASGAPVEEDVEPEREYVFPPIDFLAQDTSPKNEDVTEELRENAKRLMETLTDFNVRIKEITYSRGPTITRYELKPDAGIRVRSIANLVDDIALSLATSGVRIEAPIPDKPAVGIEVPNRNRATVYLRDLIDSEKFNGEKSRLTAALGMDVAGKPVYFDISKMPHLLIAGATGMGKSVCINSLIVSLLYKAKPEEVRLILIDPKKVEFNIYRDIPLLYTPIVIDAKRAAATLACAVAEMERRFELIEKVGVRDIKAYNSLTAGDPEMEQLPHIVIIIDELAELMMVARDQVETSICRIAQKARAAGMHLIIGTQRPSVDVITGVLKANIPSRIACTVASQVDSRTIIDVAGAEKLIGRGDMLFAPVGSSKPQRVQGAYVSEGEVESIVDYVRTNNSKVRYNRAFIENIEAEAARAEASNRKGDEDDEAGDGDGDSLFKNALRVAIDNEKISTSLLQRKLSIGYGRAAKLIDQMEEMGYVSEADGNKPRRILITREQFMELSVNGGLDE